ncbi:MAG TPA: flippase [bacterium]|nr:flippase [bacterium]
MGQTSNKIAYNTVVQIIGRIMVLAFALFSIKIITTYLGPAGTGYYNTVITLLSFVIVLADFGLFSVVVREVAKNPVGAKKIYRGAFTIRFFSAVSFSLLAVILSQFSQYSIELKQGILVASLFPVFNLLGSVFDMLYQVKYSMVKAVAAEVFSKLLTTSLIFFFARLDLGYNTIVSTVSISAILIFLTKLWLSRNELAFGFVFDKKILKELLKMSLPLGFVFIVNNVYFKIDTLILFHYHGAAAVGIYSVAYRVLETTLFAGSYLTASLKPILSISLGRDREKSERTIEQAILYLLFMALSISIACFTFPEEIILFLSNSDFLPGKLSLVVLGLAPIFVYLSGLVGEVMIARDLRRSMIKISLFILAFNILLNLYVIPRYSYNGAAASTVISELILFIISAIVARREVNIHFRAHGVARLVISAVAGTIVGVVLRNSQANFFVSLAASQATYFFLVFTLGALPTDTLKSFIGAIGKRWKKSLSR